MQGNPLAALWRNKGFIVESVKRDFYVRYINSVLGATWAVLNPLAMILVYTVVFSNVMHAKLPNVTDRFGYSIYVCSGIFAWTLFTETVQRCQMVFIENANLLKKLAFPRLSLPIIACLNALISFAILSTLFMVFLLATDSFPGWTTLIALPLLMLQILFSLALGIALGVLNVFFRDIGHGFTIIMQFWFWMTPVVYPESVLPAFAKTIIQFNPMAGIIGGYHSIFIEHTEPALSTLFIPGLATAIAALIAFGLYKKYADDMVDEL